MSHAKIFSPSASSTWLYCPAAPRIAADIVEVDKDWSLEGTNAPEQAEALLMGKKEPFPEHTQDLEPYIDLVREYANAKDAIVAYESKVEFTEWCPDGFGTADAIILDGKKLYIIDLKFGKGIAVSAEKNSQMRLYALGALQKYQLTHAIDLVEMVISQPRLDHQSHEVMTVEDLLYWGDWVKERVDAVRDENALAVPSPKNCQWCRARSVCRARTLSILSDSDEDLLRGDDISMILPLVPEVKKWCTDVTEGALRLANDGEVIDGYKLVAGRSVRKFTPIANEVLAEFGLGENEIYQPRKLATLTSIEKALGGKKSAAGILDQCTVKPVGKPTLVKTSDNRPEISSTQVASFPLGE